MGYFWSMGISFKSEELAKKCEDKIVNLTLSDNSIVKLENYISKNTKLNTFILSVYPKGMEFGDDQKLFSYPFFEEIRNQLYEYLLNLESEFNIAFFEFEAADYLLGDNIIEDISKYGLGEIQQKNSNMPYFDYKNYVPKRYFDGLVISDDEYKMIAIRYPEFKFFKKGYVWLPIKNCC